MKKHLASTNRNGPRPRAGGEAHPIDSLWSEV
jgi:hypothetical protein